MDKQQPEPIGGQVHTYAPHDCYAWNSENWHSQGEPRASYTTCGYCKRITRFRFKSIWKRIKFVFWDGVSVHIR